jgi:hypothetical protein
MGFPKTFPGTFRFTKDLRTLIVSGYDPCIVDVLILFLFVHCPWEIDTEINYVK